MAVRERRLSTLRKLQILMEADRGKLNKASIEV
jgi:hypothetical protein